MAGGMHSGGCAWLGVCMVRGDMHGSGGMHGMHVPQQILQIWHTVNEWAVRILLECILVLGLFESP